MCYPAEVFSFKDQTNIGNGFKKTFSVTWYFVCVLIVEQFIYSLVTCFYQLSFVYYIWFLLNFGISTYHSLLQFENSIETALCSDLIITLLVFFYKTFKNLQLNYSSAEIPEYLVKINMHASDMLSGSSLSLCIAEEREQN